MRITPRYDGPDIVTFVQTTEIGEAFVRQRRRLQATFALLDDDEWGIQSRCEGWTVQDVAAHLDIVNRFFHSTIAAGLAGEPTQVLDGFDPKATPAAMVEAVHEASPAETLAGFVDSNDDLCDLVGGLDDLQWSVIAEAPAGHLPVRMAIHHALWDSWVHERDIGLPLGRTLTEDADEMTACLRFVASFGPAVALNLGMARPPAVLVVESTEPHCRLVIEVTDRVVVTWTRTRALLDQGPRRDGSRRSSAGDGDELGAGRARGRFVRAEGDRPFGYARLGHDIDASVEQRGDRRVGPE